MPKAVRTCPSHFRRHFFLRTSFNPSFYTGPCGRIALPWVEEKGVFDLDVEDGIVFLGVNAHLTAQDGWRAITRGIRPADFEETASFSVSNAN